MHHLASSRPKKELDFSDFQEVLTEDLLKPILINSGFSLKKLVLDGCHRISESILSFIAKHCPNLTYLSTQNQFWQRWKAFYFLFF